jgi:outer membrane biosynthesis protein TonB
MHPRPSRPRNCEQLDGGEHVRTTLRNTRNEGRIMRILAAALGALLISTSHPALALGDHEQSELAQAEAPAAETQPTDAPQPVMQQAETQPVEAPQPAMQQAEPQQAEAPQPTIQQAETQPAEAPQSTMQQAETQPAEAPQPTMQQAETQPAEVQPPTMQQAEMQSAGAPRPVTPRAEPQQPQIWQAAAPRVDPLQSALAAVPQAGLPRDAKWTVFVELKYGTRLDLPSAVFATPDGPSGRGVGRQFKTADGRASLAVYSQRNDARDTPASYLRKNLQSRRADLDYERVTPEFFAISAVMGDSIYYSRCNFSHDAGRAIHCFDMKYPAQERQSWDGIVTRMSRSLRPLHGG